MLSIAQIEEIRNWVSVRQEELMKAFLTFVLIYGGICAVSLLLLWRWARKAPVVGTTPELPPPLAAVRSWQQKMVEASRTDEPYSVHRSGWSVEELQANLEHELARHVSCLPEGYEPVEDSVVFDIPPTKYRGLYDGSASIRLHLKPVA